MGKILLVDDEVDILRVLRRYLQDEHEILTAESARDALRIFAKEKPDVIVTDIRMPGMTGIEMMRRIKSTAADAEFIIVTGHGDLETTTTALELGAADFILKPVDIERLRESISKAINGLKMKDDIINHFQEFLNK